MALRVAVLVLVGTLAAFLPARAGDPVEPLRLERLLGSDVIACARLDTRLATWEGPVRATAMGRLVEEPEMRAALAPLGHAFGDGLKGTGPLAAPMMLQHLREALEGLSGELSVALMDGPSAEAPRFAALLDFGPRLSHVVSFLERTAARHDVGLPANAPGAAEMPVWRLETGVGGLVVSVRVVGTALIASTDAPWLLGIRPGDPAPESASASLAGSEGFLRLRERTGGDAAVAWAYVDLAHLRERLAGDGVSFGGGVGDALGLRAWRGAAYGLAFDGDRVVERVALHAPRARGLLGLLAQGAGDSVGLDLAPPSALLHAELGLEIAPAVGRAMEILDALDPDAAADAWRFLDSIRGASGVDLDREVLGRFEGRQALWCAFPPTGGLLPEIAFVARVREPAVFEARCERVLAQLVDRWAAADDVTATLRTLTDAGGARFHVIDLDRSPGDGVAHTTPTWAVIGDRLVVTFVPHTMREILARARAGDASLASDPEAARLRSDPHPQGVGEAACAVHVDTRAVLRCLYDTGVPLLQGFTDELGIGRAGSFDPALLPATRTVLPFLRTSKVSLRIDADGADVAVSAPLPPIAACAAVLLVRDILRPTPPPPPESLETSSASVRDDPESKTNEVLSQVAAALAEHRARLGAWPDGLEELVERSRLLPAVPVDGWGSRLVYARGPRPGSVTVRSAGPDGRIGTDDDRTEELEADDR